MAQTQFRFPSRITRISAILLRKVRPKLTPPSADTLFRRLYFVKQSSTAELGVDRAHPSTLQTVVENKKSRRLTLRIQQWII